MPTSQISIRPMTSADLALGARLKTAARWNQLDADWQRLLALDPGGVFVAEYEGEPVGTLATTLLGTAGWVSMVLVDEAMRGKGIGTALLEHALNYLDGRGVPSARLDATPMGQPLYEKLGFVGEYGVRRYEGVLPERPPVAAVTPLDCSRRDELIALDRRVTGTDRAKLLHALLREQPAAFRMVVHNGRIAGYLTARQGSRAWQVGPCIADADAGNALLTDACARLVGQPVFIDVPEPNTAAIALVESLGLTVQRSFLRMVRGARIFDSPREIWASFGPEKG